METKDILKKFLYEEIIKDGKKNGLKDGESLLEKGVIDSVNMIQLLAFIEERFAIKIADDQLTPENFETVNSICSLIQQELCQGVNSRNC